MKLTDAKLRALKDPGKYFDGGGLYLEVTPAGGRYWRLKIRHAGKENRLALGVYPDVGLKLAREKRTEAKAVLDRGEDPAALKREAKASAKREVATTFEGIAREWLKHQAGAWAPNTAAAIRSSLERDVFPVIGSRAMAQLKARDVKAIVQRVESRGVGDTAGRLLQRIKAVFRYAVVHDRIESNPMLDLQAHELLKPRESKHRLALPAKEVPRFLAALNAYAGDANTLTAMRVLMLTAVRPGELRGACWSELDLDAAEWRIPAERMKMKSPHLVPLSRQAVALLRQMHRISGHGALVFPSAFYPGKPLSENTLNGAIARMGFKGEHTAHGFRALFSTVANEAGKDGDVIERQLAHIERNEVRAAYHRSEYVQQRRELLQWWADWLGERARVGAADRP